ncbi:PHIKZ016 [Pseudomonas phage phiKZ]|uniref:PHIKZ016 n=1 Tax=Pseudomonas phage phiKZ TaxID=2905945 RepID=Q8SDE6_BPDPK|nr:PHIKZ016 [Pseudomonas phage phiKZ]AAL82917.1 PHIKZ016 [Pseudomonas phage phiKZ]
MSYSLGIVTRNKSALIVTSDYKYDEFVLLKPTNGLKVEGQLVQLVCICFGDKEKRSLTHEIMANAEQADYTKDDILTIMKEHGVELRVITDKAVHVFQYIRDVAIHGVVDSNNTTFWFGDTEHRKLFYPYCGIEGKSFHHALRDKELCRVFEFVTVINW